MKPRQFHSLSVALTLFVAACSQTSPSQSAPRPAMTNAEYEMAQLRALGAATDGRAPVPPSSQPATRDHNLRTAPYLVAPSPSAMPARSTGTSSTTVAPVPSTPPRTTGPVQKAGAVYIGPGGTTSRRVGSIMINSDGTTGQLIGNTIINN